MDHRHDGGHGHLELEPEGDVEGHRDEEDDQGLDGVPGDLRPQVGPTSLKLTLSGVGVGRLGQGVLDLVSIVGLLLAADFELRSAVTWICLVWLSWLVSWTTVGWVTPADSAAAVAWATVRVWRGDQPRLAALEVDAHVEAPGATARRSRAG